MHRQTELIARYEVKHLLGQGGMGAIYLAHDPSIGRQVAIKVLHQGLATEDLRRRFVQEARACGALTHPHIVTVYDFGEFNNAPFIVMEYIQGETLAEIIRRGRPVTVAQKLRWIEAVCNALSYAHRANIIHRDIKPSNLMLDQHGMVKVLDFGIVRVVDAGLTQATMVIGTPGYMSPEQIEGGAIDARSDVFAVGAALYELLSSRPAFEAPTPHAVMSRVLHSSPARLAIEDYGSEEVAAIVEKALQKDPAARYADMSAMEAAVRNARVALERDLPALTTLAAASRTDLRAEARAGPPHAFVNSSEGQPRWSFIGIATILGMVAAFAVWTLSSRIGTATPALPAGPSTAVTGPSATIASPEPRPQMAPPQLGGAPSLDPSGSRRADARANRATDARAQQTAAQQPRSQAAGRANRGAAAGVPKTLAAVDALSSGSQPEQTQTKVLPPTVSSPTTETASPPLPTTAPAALFLVGTWEGVGTDDSGPGKLTWRVTQQSNGKFSGRFEAIDEKTRRLLSGELTGVIDNGVASFLMQARVANCALIVQGTVTRQADRLTGGFRRIACDRRTLTGTLDLGRR